MKPIIDFIYNLIWSDALIYLCLLTGIYFTIRFRFPQFTRLKEMIRLLFADNKSENGISSFQAFSLAVSGRVGTGNIAGVATAIAMGGPGAVFWMWVIALLGSASALVEATLGQMYKEEKDGQYRGGPAFYIQKGLKNKTFAWVFAIVTIISTGFLLPSVQSNSIATSVKGAFNLSPYLVGGVLIVFLAIIIFGGVKRIGKVAEFVVPIMAGFYILMAFIIIGLNIQQVPAIFTLIIKSALNLESSFGAVVGSAIA
ncbi:MAG: alanine/glycine:cation symporter family protein, partial [Sphingobacterium sp.]